MDCKGLENDISAYVDGELERQRAAQLEAHFESCECCRELRDQMSRLKTSIGDLPEPEVSPETFLSPAVAVTPQRFGKVATILSRVAAVAAVAIASFALGIGFSSMSQRSLQLASPPSAGSGAGAEKGAAPRSRDQIGAAESAREQSPTTGAGSIGSGAPSGSYGAPAPTSVKIERYTGPKPANAAYVYRLTVGESVVLIAIDRRGKVLWARPAKR